MCLNDMHNNVWVGKLVSDAFPIHWSETRRSFITTAHQMCFRICH